MAKTGEEESLDGDSGGDIPAGLKSCMRSISSRLDEFLSGLVHAQNVVTAIEIQGKEQSGRRRKNVLRKPARTSDLRSLTREGWGHGKSD